MYGLKQGAGQLKIVREAEDLDHFLALEDYPDSLKQKLLLVKEIKRYCEDSLKLLSGDNYGKMFDQKGQPGMYVLTASKEFELVSYQWSFPFLGKFTYKGFFDLDKAKKERDELDNEGYDTDLSIVNAWSTLGWFKDPVMSSMLNLSEGKLARVLIHEITHYNVFIKDDIQYNENLASFIGDKGARKFLIDKYGKGSIELLEFENFLHDIDLFTSYMMAQSVILSKFYSELDSTDEKSFGLKKARIRSMIFGLKTQGFKNDKLVNKILAQVDSVNNTFFTDFLMYRKENAQMENKYLDQFKGDINLFIEEQKLKHGKN
jgi:predicted aminopeptidase